MTHAKHLKHVERDEWGRPVTYLAQFQNAIYGGWCLFTNAEAAIFYVITGLGSDVDWSTFPAEGRKYPDEERNGNDEPLNPLFVVDRKTADGRPITATVHRAAAMDDWAVGNGIAEWSKSAFLEATGNDLVALTGKGSKLSAVI